MVQTYSGGPEASRSGLLRPIQRLRRGQRRRLLPLHLLKVGGYELKAKAAGFAGYQQTGIRLAVDQQTAST